MSVLFDDVKEAWTRAEAMAYAPVSRRGEDVASTVHQVEAFMASGSLDQLQRLSLPQRSVLMGRFQALVDHLRWQVEVGDEIQRLGEPAPWVRELATLVARLDVELRQRGLELAPSPPSNWKVFRHPITGEPLVSQRRADSAPPPPFEDSLRGIIALAQRMTRIPDVMVAAQMLDQNIENLRPLVAQERTIAELRGEPATRADELAQVLREAEAALEQLTLVLDAEAVRVAMAEPGESIPFEQLRRELGL